MRLRINAIKFPSGRVGMDMLGAVGAVGASAIVSQLLAAALIVKVARELGPAEFGELAATMSVAAILVAVWNFGTVTYTSRQCARNEIIAREAVRLTGTLLRTLTAFLLILATPLALLGVLTAGEVLATLFFAVTMAGSMALQGHLRARGRFRAASSLAILERGLPLIVALALGSLGIWSPSYFLWVLAIGSGASIVLSSWQLSSVADMFRRPIVTQRELYIRSRAVGSSELASSLSALEIPLTAVVGGSTSAGIFSSASKLAGPLALVINAAVAVATPELARHRGNTRAAAFSIRYLLRLLPAYWFMLALVATFAEEVIDLAFGTAFSESVGPLRVLTASLFLSSISQFLAAILRGQDHDATVATAFAVGIPTGLAVTGVGSIHWGPLGASLGALSAQVVILAVLGTSLAATLRKSRCDVTPQGYVGAGADALSSHKVDIAPL